MPDRLPPGWVVRPLLALRNGVARLHDGMVPAQLPLFERTLGIVDTKAMAVVADLRVADRLAGGPADAATLAAAAGVDADALERLLRYLVARGVFRRDRSGRYRNNRVSALLADDPASSMRAWARFYGAPWHVAGWNELGHSVRTGDAGAAVAFGRPFWSHLTEHDLEAGALFDAAMADASRLQAGLLARRHDFSRCRSVCDVGGGTGTLLAGILAAHPQLHGTLYDLPAVVAKAAPTLVDAGVAERVTVIGGDFFDAVPSGCDRYVLQAVVHDWDDESCVRILSNVRTAMAPDGRVLVLEQELPHHDGARLVRALDLEMLVDSGAGRERTRAEYEALFERAGLAVAKRGALAVLTIFELAPV